MSDALLVQVLFGVGTSSYGCGSNGVKRNSALFAIQWVPMQQGSTM